MAEVKIKPLGDRVIVKPIERETMKGGIIIPDTAKEKPMEGEVLAVGPGKVADKGVRTEMDVKVGDRVLYGKYSGTEVKLDNETYLIISSFKFMFMLHKEIIILPYIRQLSPLTCFYRISIQIVYSSIWNRKENGGMRSYNKLRSCCH